ncbi:gfo/Idh/MocA family oxidoreductase [Streptomyces fagopyri]|uniref:Gfo/Idh/MocA family oxidoreductase n=1 Tax=Streptomyces fagopyri TaxID=2662397 RepID=A0A5Q0LNY1_9ACTN|nr:Gfo/Idh/MocA family oxidoreductase [Streptomyces fagopyri]QFZ78219.1 gfo/Idh/MocA family oxidoreductase [Streptomyces fagopyri]
MEPTGVGVIGGSTSGWASLSHIPAINASAAFELRAVSTSRPSSARAAAAEYGVPAYDNHQDLVAHPGVDLVVVAVKVTEHLELVSAALDAGKMVYSEWPLGNGLAEAELLSQRAGAAGVRTVVGLQGRYAPEVRFARDLIRDGYVGRVLGTTLSGSGMVWGPEVATHGQAYWYDRANGATPLTSPTLHALDPLHHVLGEFESVAANLVVGRTRATVAEDGRSVPVTAADQVAVIGTLAGGASASVFYRGGTSRAGNFRWEINGTEGDLVLTADWGNMQVAALTLAGGRGADAVTAPLPVPASYTGGLSPDLAASPAANVARLYERFARDLADGTHTVPDFAHALARHRLIDAIEQAAATGATRTPVTTRTPATVPTGSATTADGR